MVARKAVDALAVRGLIDWEDKTNGVFEISAKGIAYVESHLDFEDSTIAQYADQLGRRAQAPGIDGPRVPTASGSVSLEHNSAPYQETVESVDKVIEELKKDQPLDNELGQERHALIQAVEAGRRLLDDTRMNIEIGVKLLLEPLLLVAKKYTQVLLGALAGKAVDLVTKLLGLG